VPAVNKDCSLTVGQVIKDRGNKGEGGGEEEE
jgi:hypothetical protein